MMAMQSTDCGFNSSQYFASLRQALQNDAQRLQEAGIAPWAAVTVKLG